MSNFISLAVSSSNPSPDTLPQSPIGHQVTATFSHIFIGPQDLWPIINLRVLIIIPEIHSLTCLSTTRSLGI